MIKNEYRQSARYKYAFTQKQIQSVSLLAMGSQDLHEFLQNEYLENPLLEYVGRFPDPGSPEEYREWRGYGSKPGSGTFHENHGGDNQNEFREPVAVPERGIKSYLKSQLIRKHYTDQEWMAIDVLIECLDEKGYFTVPLDEIACMTGISRYKLDGYLEELKELEPVGIFQENLVNCLLKQLEVQGIEDKLLENIIKYHLEDIADGKISSITRNLEISSAQARRYTAFISNLNPCPMSGFCADDVVIYIVPDIICEYEGGKWKISLNDEWIENYQLNDYYLQMIEETGDRELQDYFKTKLDHVTWILNSIEERRKNLVNITRKLIEYQQDFFFGDKLPLALTMAELAESLNIAVSTVSRAVKDKVLQYPGGVIPMRSLFSLSPVKTGGKDSELITALHVKEALTDLIENENKQKTYSDQQLSKKLKEKDIFISRRTVAKYRDDLGIKGSFERREKGDN